MEAFDETAVSAQLDTKEAQLSVGLGELNRPVEPGATIGFGKRIGDGTSEAIQRMADASSSQALSQTLEQVRRARAKLAEGSYGLCDVCRAPIGEARLEFRPWSVTCVQHAS